MKRQYIFENNVARAAISSKNSYGEYVVRLRIGGVPQPKANYFTDDFTDAQQTAQAMIDHAISGSHYKKNPSEVRSTKIKNPSRRAKANWQTFAGGTSAHHGNSYALYLGKNSQFSINPPRNRIGGYTLQSFNVVKPYWVSHGSFRSPQAAKSAALRILADSSAGRPLRDIQTNPRRALKIRRKGATVGKFNMRRVSSDPRKVKRVIRKLYGRSVQINPLSNVLKGNPMRGAQFNVGKRRKQLPKQLQYPMAEKHVAQIKNYCKVQADATGKQNWRTVAMFPCTPQGEENAKQYAKIVHRRYPKLTIRVVK